MRKYDPESVKTSTMVDQHPWLTNSPPDLAILVVAAYRAVIDRLVAAMRDGGLGEVRPMNGFVIRAVAAERPTIQRLAELLDSSKQFASKIADEMVRAGFLRRVADPGDRRLSRLVLAARGERVLRRALATSAALERELARAVGPRGVAELRRALLALLARQGGLEDVRARRARPVWDRPPGAGAGGRRRRTRAPGI